MTQQFFLGPVEAVAGGDVQFAAPGQPYADLPDELVARTRNRFSQALHELTIRYWINRHFAASAVIWLAAAVCGGVYVEQLFAGRDMIGFGGAVMALGIAMVFAIQRLERHRKPLDYARRDLRQQLDLLDQEAARRYRLSVVKGLN